MLIYAGTFLEFFEFVLFVTLFPLLNKILSVTFSSQDQATLQYLLFWCGFIARPLGAMLLLYKGDTFKRRHVLIFSVIGMSITTILMGCIPLNISPLLLVFLIAGLRLFQGFFTGIEYSSASIYIYELSKPNEKEKSVVYMGLAATLGTASAYLVSAFCQLNVMSAVHFWRFTFLISGILGFIIGALRLKKLPEASPTPVSDEPIQFNKKMLAGFFIIGMSYAPFYYISSYLNIYNVVLEAASPSLPFLYNAFIFFVYGIIIWCILNKLHNTIKFLKASYISFILLITPLSYVCFHFSYTALPLQLLLILLTQIIVCHTVGKIPALFKEGNRLRSYTLIQTFAASILGGATPLICHGISSYTQTKWLAGLYIAFLSALSYASYRYIFSKDTMRPLHNSKI